jgi:hypothetical protein
MDEKKAKFMEHANKMIDRYESRSEDGMSHADQAGFAERFYDLLRDAIEIIEAAE